METSSPSTSLWSTSMSLMALCSAGDQLTIRSAR